MRLPKIKMWGNFQNNISSFVELFQPQSGEQTRDYNKMSRFPVF